MTNSTENLVKCFHSGLEKHDLEALMQCYDDNAEVRIVDRNHPPKQPMMIRGKPAIRNFYSDILSRNLKHHIDMEAISDQVAAFTETCVYPNGTQVLSNDMCKLSNGKISQQTTVQAWDE